MLGVIGFVVGSCVGVMSVDSDDRVVVYCSLVVYCSSCRYVDRVIRVFVLCLFMFYCVVCC